MRIFSVAILLFIFGCAKNPIIQRVAFKGDTFKLCGDRRATDANLDCMAKLSCGGTEAERVEGGLETSGYHTNIAASGNFASVNTRSTKTYCVTFRCKSGISSMPIPEIPKYKKKGPEPQPIIAGGCL